MKKYFFLLGFFVFPLFCFSETPEFFQGIWKGDDRYIFFGKNNEIAVILKGYYGWYYDRAAEPEEFETLSPRKRNISTVKHGKRITTDFTKISSTDEIWEINLDYGKKEKSIIPVFINGNELYLNFLLKIPFSNEPSIGSLEANGDFSSNPLFGYWQGINEADSIRIFERKNSENIISWYITSQGVYRLRFWKTDMKNEDSKAAFADGSIIYTINKHIFSAGKNYTCVNGKSSNIRNVEKYPTFPVEYKLNETGTVLTLKSPYLVKLTDADSAEELIEIINIANSRRKPDSPPLFEEEKLDWHWDLINQLEKGNSQIQEVRKRQKEFGPRAQDIENKK